MKLTKEVHFSENLKQFLEQRHNTISHLSKVTGLNKSTLHNYINGIQPKGLTAIIKISQFFDIPIDQLVFMKKTEFQNESLPILPTSEGRYEIYIKKI